MAGLSKRTRQKKIVMNYVTDLLTIIEFQGKSTPVSLQICGLSRNSLLSWIRRSSDCSWKPAIFWRNTIPLKSSLSTFSPFSTSYFRVFWVWLLKSFWLDYGIYWTILIQRVTTPYRSLLNTHTTVHSYVFIAVACYLLPTADVPLPLGSRTVPGSRLPHSKSSSSQHLNPSSPLTNSLTNSITH
jgi:hypothetical protein